MPRTGHATRCPSFLPSFLPVLLDRSVLSIVWPPTPSEGCPGGGGGLPMNPRENCRRSDPPHPRTLLWASGQAACHSQVQTRPLPRPPAQHPASGCASTFLPAHLCFVFSWTSQAEGLRAQCGAWPAAWTPGPTSTALSFPCPARLPTGRLWAGSWRKGLPQGSRGLSSPLEVQLLPAPTL